MMCGIRVGAEDKGDDEDRCGRKEVLRSPRCSRAVTVRKGWRRDPERGSFLLQSGRGSVMGRRPFGSTCYCQAVPTHTGYSLAVSTWTHQVGSAGPIQHAFIPQTLVPVSGLLPLKCEVQMWRVRGRQRLTQS